MPPPTLQTFAEKLAKRYPSPGDMLSFLLGPQQIQPFPGRAPASLILESRLVEVDAFVEQIPVPTAGAR